MPLILNKIVYFVTDFKFYLLFIFSVGFIGLILLLWKRTKLLLSLVAITYTLVAVFALGEIYFRYIYDQSDGLGFLKVNLKWHQRHVIFNNYFRRDRQFDQAKGPDEIRIAVIGDSITFGGGIKNPADRFSDLLQTKLRADGLNVSVYNLGISGTGTQEQIKNFNDLQHLNFDLLVWQYYLNDANPTNGGLGTQIILANQAKFIPPPLVKFLTDRSFFADWLYWRLSAKYDQTFKDLVAADLKAYQDKANFSRHQAQITAFISQLKRQHLPVVVIVFPFLYQSPQAAASQTVYQNLLDMFNTSGAASVINLNAALSPYSPTALMASRFDSHPNALVHHLAADLLYQAVKPIISHDR